MPPLDHSPATVRLDTSLEALFQHRSTTPAKSAMATLVATLGSTYRKPGARMLIAEDGSFQGLLSGGCLESDLHLQAATVLGGGEASAVEYDMRGPDDVLFGMGAGCAGMLRILLESTAPGSRAAAALAAAIRETALGRGTVLVAVHESPNVPLGTYHPDVELPGALLAVAQTAVQHRQSSQVTLAGLGHGAPTRAFVQFLAPPPHLLICGAAPDAEPVARAALGLSWRVTIVDHRPAYANSARFPGAAVHCLDAHRLGALIDLPGCHAAVVMSHHLQSDISYLRQLAQSATPGYIGLLGPSARRRRIVDELGALAGVLTTRLRGPVGIDIGAATPEGIALSIVSQIHGWLAGR